jgi:hypothetical protein
MKLKLPNTHPVQALFYAAGLLSTAASVKGTLGYLLTETEGDLLLSGAGAVCLGLSAYFGWEVVFNHKGWGKRAAAVLIAAAASSLSAYTVYQHTAYPELKKQATAAAAQAQDAKDRATQVDATLRQQQADLRDQISELRKQNEADTGRVDLLSHSGKKSAARQVAQLRTTIAGREAEIGKLSTQVENYTQRLTATPTGETPAQASAAEPLVLSWAMLARASIYDLMTALFMLFAGWFRSHRQERGNREAGVLQAATLAAAGQAEELQRRTKAAEQAVARIEATLLRASEPVERSTENSPEPVERSTGCSTGSDDNGIPEVTEQDILLLLKNSRVEADGEGLITTEILMGLTGWGHRKAKKCKETAHLRGFLGRERKGKGWVYFYPARTESLVIQPEKAKAEVIELASFGRH